MNIIQAQNTLKDLSDSQLQRQLLNPDGSVPSFLVLTELQRRKDMRDSYAKQEANGSSMADEFTKGLGQADVGKYGDALRGAMPGPGQAGAPMGQPPMQAPPQMEQPQMAAMDPGMQGGMPGAPAPEQPMFANGGAVMATPAPSAPVQEDVSTWVDYLSGKKGPMGVMAGPAFPVIGAISEGRPFKDVLTTMSPAMTALKSMGVKFAEGGIVQGDTDYDNQPGVEADRAMMMGMPHDGGPAYAGGGVVDAFADPMGMNRPRLTPEQTLARGLAVSAGKDQTTLLDGGSQPGQGLPSAAPAPAIAAPMMASSPMGVGPMGSADGATGDGSGNGGDAGGVGAGVGTGVGDAAASAAAAAADAASNSDAGAAGMASGGMVKRYQTGGGVKAFQVGGSTGIPPYTPLFMWGNHPPSAMWPDVVQADTFLNSPSGQLYLNSKGYRTPAGAYLPYGNRQGSTPTPMAYQRNDIYGKPPEPGYDYGPVMPSREDAREAQERIGVEGQIVLPYARGNSPDGSLNRLSTAPPPPPVTGVELKQWSYPPYNGYPGASSVQTAPQDPGYGTYQDPGSADGMLPPGGLPSAANPPGSSGRPPANPAGGGVPSAGRTGVGPAGVKSGGAGGPGGAGSGLLFDPDSLAAHVKQVQSLGLPDRFGEMEARNREDRDKLLAGVEGEKGMALLTAGAAMLGSDSPFAGVGIGRGALAGVKQWGDAQKEMRQAQQAIRQAENQIAIARANRDEKQLETGVRTWVTAQEAQQKALDRANAAGIAAAGRADALRLKEMELKDSALNRAEVREQHEIDGYQKAYLTLTDRMKDVNQAILKATAGVQLGEAGAKEALEAANAQYAGLQQQAIAAQSLYQRQLLERTARRNDSTLIHTKQEYDSLKPGTRYLDGRSGKIKVKGSGDE